VSFEAGIKVCTLWRNRHTGTNLSDACVPTLPDPTAAGGCADLPGSDAAGGGPASSSTPDTTSIDASGTGTGDSTSAGNGNESGNDTGSQPTAPGRSGGDLEPGPGAPASGSSETGSGSGGAGSSTTIAAAAATAAVVCLGMLLAGLSWRKRRSRNREEQAEEAAVGNQMEEFARLLKETAEKHFVLNYPQLLGEATTLEQFQQRMALLEAPRASVVSTSTAP